MNKVEQDKLFFKEAKRQITKLKDDNATLKELTKAQDAYIKFIGKELNRHESMAVVRPYMAASTETIRQGIEHRNKIAILKSKI